MAKNSMIARENKRTRAVKRFAARRAELKTIIKVKIGTLLNVDMYNYF